MAGRALNVLLGAWLFISAFVWPHDTAQFTNSWILGVVCVAAGFIAMSVDKMRYLNTALSVWLFLSVFLLGTQSEATRWSNILVAVGIFVLSLTPSERLQLPAQTPRTV